MAEYQPSSISFPSYNTPDVPVQSGMQRLADIIGVQKGQLELSKARQTLPSEVARTRAEATNAIARANTTQLENLIAHSNNSITNLRGLRDKDKIDDSEVEKLVTDTIYSAGGNEQAIKQVLMDYPKNGTLADKKAWLAQKEANAAGHVAALEKRYPNTQNVDTGANIINVTTGNPTQTGEPTGMPTGVYLPKTLAPTVATSPTGGPMQFGGGAKPQIGNINALPSNVQIAPAGGGATATGMQQNAPQVNAPQGGGVTSQSMNQPKGGVPIPYVPGEPYDAFRTRAGDVAKMPKAASEALNINNIDSIPNARYTNEKIQKMLDNPNLNIGPIADAIAKQTGGIGLSAEQQEIMKYLEQRIRMESARTNQDQASQRTAFGSFGTQKGALREILYKDNGNLAGQELYQRGILNHAGDINKPNLQSVNQFNNDYAKLAEPRVVHLIGVIGDKSTKDLTKSDRQHLAKEFSGLSDNQIQELMNKRQKLLDLVGK